MTCRQLEAGWRGLVFGCFRFFNFFSIFFAFSLPDVVARLKRDGYRKLLAEHFGFENANKWIVCIKFVQSASKRAVNVRNCEKEVPRYIDLGHNDRLPGPIPQASGAAGVRGVRAEPASTATRRPIGKISAKCCSFSPVSAPIFASQYAFFSIFWDLHWFYKII